MILALELCEEIVVYGMVSDSYCRSGQPGARRGDTVFGPYAEDMWASA